MIARQWIGETLEADADAYGKYQEKTDDRKPPASDSPPAGSGPVSD